MVVLVMQAYGVSDRDMCASARWLTMTDKVMKMLLQWLGHVVRIPVDRAPKQAMFGWIDTQGEGSISGRLHQSAWLRRCLVRVEVPEFDWFRFWIARVGGT